MNAAARRRPPWLMWVPAALCIGVCFLLLFAAGVKLWDMTEFRNAVASWNIIPTPLIPVVTLLVPLLEVLAVTIFLAGKGIGIYRWSVPLTVLIFTAAFVVESVVSPEPVKCACLGSMIKLDEVPV